MHGITRSKNKGFKNLFIRWFIHQYDVDMSLAEIEDYRQFEHFNSFFTRKLKSSARPICNNINTIACPVDGAVSQIGAIHENAVFQAKSRKFKLESLLAGQTDLSSQFENGEFATLYLSPKDYHRIHMPISGTLKQMTYVPGRLFSVSPATTRALPELFARNERVICVFDTEVGPMAVILVGALFVGSMETVWQGVITPPHGRHIRHWHYNQPAENLPLNFKKGDEIGRFNMGSTVILLFSPGSISWNTQIGCSSKVTMGMELGKICRPE